VVDLDPDAIDRERFIANSVLAQDRGATGVSPLTLGGSSLGRLRDEVRQRSACSTPPRLKDSADGTKERDQTVLRARMRPSATPASRRACHVPGTHPPVRVSQRSRPEPR
jgi:hypothetical protein